MDDVNLILLIGELRGRLEVVEKRMAELEARPATAPAYQNAGQGGKWETTGETSHTITHIARGKDSKGSLFLLLWNARGNFSVSFYWIGEKNKDEILARIEELSGVKFNTMPWINDVKAENIQAQMKPCKTFLFRQVIKVRDTDGKKKYFFKDVIPAEGDTPSSSKPASTPAPAPQNAVPELTRQYDLNVKLLELWKKHGIPEGKARHITQDLLQVEDVDRLVDLLVEPITLNADFLQKGFYIPADEDDLAYLYNYGKRLYGLSVDQVKAILKWTANTKLRTDAHMPTGPGEFELWHFEYIIDLAHKDAKSTV